MTSFLRRIREAWRRSGKRGDSTAIENARVAHEASEREKHGETELPPGQSIPPV
jgi:hypothetical protein